MEALVANALQYQGKNPYFWHGCLQWKIDRNPFGATLCPIGYICHGRCSRWCSLGRPDTSVCVCFYMYLWSQLCWVFQTHGYLIYNILKWYTMDAQNKNGANLKDSVLTARTNKKKQLTAARKACLQSQCLRLDDVLRLWNNPLE